MRITNPHALLRGISSVGRALAWHARGQGFKSPILHFEKRWFSQCFCSGPRFLVRRESRCKPRDQRTHRNLFVKARRGVTNKMARKGRKNKLTKAESPVFRQWKRKLKGTPRRVMESFLPLYDVVGWVTYAEAAEIVGKLHPARYPNLTKTAITTWITRGYLQAFRWNDCETDFRLVRLSQLLNLPEMPLGRNALKVGPPISKALPETIELTLVRRDSSAPKKHRESLSKIARLSTRVRQIFLTRTRSLSRIVLTCETWSQ